MQHRLLTKGLALAAGLLLAATAITPATAVPNPHPMTLRYTALGDSYAAGLGAGLPLYQDASGRSSEAYPVQLVGKAYKVNFLAYSGYEIADVMAQVTSVPTTTRRITLTVGGNDVGFMTVAQTCAETPSLCQDAILAAAEELGDMGADLGLLIMALKTQAPKATIFVTWYPQIFQPSLTLGCPALPLLPVEALYAADSAIESLNPAIQPGLNDVIQGVAMGAGAVYVDVNVPQGICTAPDVYIFATTLNGGVPLHPTAAGQAAYAAAIMAAGFDS